MINLYIIKFLTVSLRINCKMSTEQPVRRAIQDKLMKAFEPTHLEIINESHMHNVPKGAETHFKVLVVAEKFANVPLLKVNFTIYFK